MNDQGSMEDAGGGLFRMNRICLRRFLNVFLTLYRHIQLNDTSIVLEGPVMDCGLKMHHIVASGDDFATISMNWDLMPAAKLNYMHDFPGKNTAHAAALVYPCPCSGTDPSPCRAGMYNCVSQVAYFHNPRYETRVQERLDVQSVSAGTAQAVHVLPCLLQIHPEIGVLYEESHVGCNHKGYNWLVVGRRVYLLSPDGSTHYHENVIGLLWHYRSATGL